MASASLNRAYLNRIETAVPAHDVHAKFASFVPNLVHDERVQKLFARLASKSQIEHRWSVIAPASERSRLDTEDFYALGSFPATGARMKRFEKEALALAREPVQRILEKAGREKITHLIVTSCTGFYAPGLDLEIQREFGLRSDLERTVVGFMGCYAAFNALKIAKNIVAANREAQVLLVNIELCTLHLQESADPEQLLAFLQFADGCAASLVTGEPFGLELDRFHAEVMPENRELIEWHIGDHGFEMVLSPEVPKALALALPEVKSKLMCDDEFASTVLWAVHPGGRAILDAAQDRFEIKPEVMKYSRDVLRNYGNMSSCTILFVLRDILNDVSAQGDGAAMAFGPGLTIEFLRFHKRAH